MANKKRWRAEKRGYYCFIDMAPHFIVKETPDWYCELDDYYYQSGNYFRTKEEAEEVVKKIKKLLKDE